jgi:hypothetical protein
MRHRPQLTSPKLFDGNFLHAADFWTWSSGYDERERLRGGWRDLAGAPEGSELALRAFAYFGGRALYDDPPKMAQISAGRR